MLRYSVKAYFSWAFFETCALALYLWQNSAGASAWWGWYLWRMRNSSVSVEEFCWRICLVGVAFWVSHYIFVVCLNYSAARQVLRIRQGGKMLSNTLKFQEVTYRVCRGKEHMRAPTKYGDRKNNRRDLIHPLSELNMYTVQCTVYGYYFTKTFWLEYVK